MAVGAVGTRDNATPGSSTLPIAARHFDNLSPSSQFVLLGWEQAPILAMLTLGVGIPHEVVNNRKFDTLNRHPKIVDFLIYGDDGTGTKASITTARTTFQITDPSGTVSDARKLILVGDVIHIPAYQDNQTTADGTVAVAGELIEVASIASDGSYFTVTRNIGSTASTGNVAAASESPLNAELQLPADEEVTRSREALSHAAFTQTNYIQNVQEPFAVSLDLEATLLAGGSEWNWQQDEKFISFMTKLERVLLFGRKDTSIVDSMKYRTQGWASYLVGDTTTYAAYDSTADLINGDGSSRLWKIGSPANLNVENWMRATGQIFSEGSNNKILVCGRGFAIQMALMLEGYMTLPIPMIGTNGIEANFTFNAIQSPGTRPLPIMVHPLMNTASHFYSAIVFDLNHIGVKVFNGGAYGQGEPHIWRGLNNDGLQENDATEKKWAWTAQMGAHMTYQLAHGYFFGMESPSGGLNGPQRTVGTLTPSDT